MTSPSINQDKQLPHRMSNLDLESMKHATVASHKEMVTQETMEFVGETVVTHSQRATVCSKILNYMEFLFATIVLMLSFGFLTALDFQKAEIARFMLVFALIARPLACVAITFVQYHGFKRELKVILRSVGANPAASSVDEMVAHLEGENQLRLMAQLIALTRRMSLQKLALPVITYSGIHRFIDTADFPSIQLQGVIVDMLGSVVPITVFLVVYFLKTMQLPAICAASFAMNLFMILLMLRHWMDEPENTGQRLSVFHPGTFVIFRLEAKSEHQNKEFGTEIQDLETGGDFDL